MTIQNFVNKTQSQNQEIQVFIIKQIERSEKDEFEAKYANYINGKNIFLNDSATNIVNNLISSGGRQNYLIPLIYDEPSKDKIKLEEMKINGELYYYSQSFGIGGSSIYQIPNTNIKYFKNKIKNFYYFNKYSFLLECPLIDYTKLSYVYQVKNNKMLGIGNVTSISTQFNINSSSNCNINFVCGDNDEINKDMFDVNDIVIVKILKNQKDINKIKNNNNKNIYDDEFNYYKNIFTGYIDNVNYTIDWGSKSKILNLICSGPSKKMLFTRIITGQATGTSNDIIAALTPLSVYSYPETRNENNEITISNQDVVKSIVIRTFCDIDSIDTVKENKLNVEYYFNQNAIALTKNSQNYQNIYNYKKKYEKAITDNMSKFFEVVKDDNDNNTYIKIRNNQNSLITETEKITSSPMQINVNNITTTATSTSLIPKKIKKQLPIMIVNGTNQPAYQYTFDNLKNTFIAQFDTLFQFLRKIATTLDFCLYDDVDGTIHFEVYNTSLMHLYNMDDANHLNNIITFTENQNTNEMYNIVQTSACGTLQGMPQTDQFGVYALIRDQKSVNKLGERYLNLGSIIGLQNNVDDKSKKDNNIIEQMYLQPLSTYARCMMQRVNSKAMSQISVRLLGNPLITMGKYAYIKDLGKLFYINSIRQTWSSDAFYTIDLTGIYTREKICNLGELTDNKYTNIGIESKKVDENISTITDMSTLIPNSRKDSTIAKFEYVRQYINNKLQDAYNNNDVISTLQKYFYTSKNFYSKIADILKKKFYYDDDNYLKLIYDNRNYIFTYLDGYFWEIPIQSDAYNLALQIEKQNKG